MDPTLTNGGYISEVSPLLGSPGLFEANHYYFGGRDSLAQLWRFPPAMEDPILPGATITKDLPDHLDPSMIVCDSESTAASIGNWDPTYAAYSSSANKTGASPTGEGTAWTATLPLRR